MLRGMLRGVAMSMGFELRLLLLLAWLERSRRSTITLSAVSVHGVPSLVHPLSIATLLVLVLLIVVTLVVHVRSLRLLLVQLGHGHLVEVIATLLLLLLLLMLVVRAVLRLHATLNGHTSVVKGLLRLVLLVLGRRSAGLVGPRPSSVSRHAQVHLIHLPQQVLAGLHAVGHTVVGVIVHPRQRVEGGDDSRVVGRKVHEPVSALAARTLQKKKEDKVFRDYFTAIHGTQISFTWSTADCLMETSTTLPN